MRTAGHMTGSQTSEFILFEQFQNWTVSKLNTLIYFKFELKIVLNAGFGFYFLHHRIFIRIFIFTFFNFFTMDFFLRNIHVFLIV